MRKSFFLLLLVSFILICLPNDSTAFAEGDQPTTVNDPTTNPTPPDSPSVKEITNVMKTISGTAEPNSTVWLVVNNSKEYTVKLDDSSSFTIQLENSKPLNSGTKVSIYAVNNAGMKSAELKLTVKDKIPPATPKVNKISTQSFSISGTTSAKAKVYIKRNSKSFKTLTASSTGKFSMRIPLQSAGTTFEVYAIDAAKNKSNSTKIKVYSKARASKKIVSAPIIKQMPALPRGCEVTSLAMLLGDAGINANKMTLAAKVKRDPTPYRIIKGKIHFGNPHYGFVGNMYTFSKPGFGVFNKPIEQLAKQYLPNRIVNLTKGSFDTVLNYVSAGKPVWVVNTSWFSRVPSSYWQTWYTPKGKIKITYKEHSVLVTGYDKKYVYFNDPLDGKKNKKKSRKSFVEGWKQYGSQAISYF
ncbi:C39 family peptidase [Bacillus massilinigeriensis]|uniref:C39 family peptidase n=1 Tax=Bacillus massilionigeriensis TaxID=1805475 RepID=UPI000A4D301B|nr:C39 family peptidase [Bacillus massilionigeriensis]